MDNFGLIMSYYYIGRIHEDNHNLDSVAFNFRISDSLYQLTKDPFPELRHIYGFLVNYYKQNKDLNNQLLYVERLLEADSILDINEIYLNTSILKEYDIPQLKQEQASLATQLTEERSTSRRMRFFIVAVTLVFLIVILWFYLRQRRLKQRFDELMSQNKTIYEHKEVKPEDSKELDLPEDIVETLLTRLQAFEEKGGFLDSELSLRSLAKVFGTNDSYLSKVVNHYKQVNFSNYLKELRLNYVIERLKVDSDLRKYTISAIAKEAGFKNETTFSRAFYKKTGMNPSYFIGKLEKLDLSVSN